ncbi:GL11232 [Drosophila persimilis]|nr:GL11232 [Drosophila persimilis]
MLNIQDSAFDDMTEKVYKIGTGLPKDWINPGKMIAASGNQLGQEDGNNVGKVARKTAERMI